MVKELIKLVGDKAIITVTHPQNTGAIILYLEHGFKIVGWKDDYYGDGQPRLMLEYKPDV